MVYIYQTFLFKFHIVSTTQLPKFNGEPLFKLGILSKFCRHFEFPKPKNQKAPKWLFSLQSHVRQKIDWQDWLDGQPSVISTWEQKFQKQQKICFKTLSTENLNSLILPLWINEDEDSPSLPPLSLSLSFSLPLSQKN